MKTFLLFISIFTISAFRPLMSQELRYSTAMFSLMCPQETDLDKENALVTYNPTTHILSLTSDVYEVTDNILSYDTTATEEVDGLPISMTVKIDIPDIEFKSARNTGERYTFNTLISCNGIEKTIPVTYVYIHAPNVAHTASALNFRLGFSVSLNPKDFQFNMPENCAEIIMKVQDAWLNLTRN